jgi:NAD(P)-dependent dehydrogenase (short-subunit alcohol dehydrogenase family)
MTAMGTLTGEASSPLAGRKALVTGASGGIGRALAVALARAGADVAVHHFDDPVGGEETAATIRALGRQAFLIGADIRVVAQIEDMVAAVVTNLGGLDTLVNNAGITGWNDALDVSEALWDQVIDTNLKGTFFCSTAAARHMKAHGGGAIVNVSTIVSLTCMRNLSVYAASKAGINMMTRQLAFELAAHGIRVNAIAPGPILVPRTLADDPDYATNWGQTAPLGRVGVPEDLTGAVTFFASDQASWVTGQILAIDGGVTLPGRVPETSMDRGLARNQD